MSDNNQKRFQEQLSLAPSSVCWNGCNALPYEMSFNGVHTGGAEAYSQEGLFSNETKEIMEHIRSLKVPQPHVVKSFSNNETLDETLFDVRAKIKILISQVSMYITEDWRSRLYRQIDILHDPDDWEDEDKPISLLSFKTFLRWFFLSKPERPPGFGLSYTGNFIAAWASGKDKLILEFLPNDTIKWVVTKSYEGELERATGIARSARITSVLSPYSTEDWFNVNKGSNGPA